MDDTIYRQTAIAYAISGLTRELEGEKWIRVSEVRESLKTMPSAERQEAQSSQCEYWDDESNFCALYRPSAERHGRWDGGSCSVCGFSWYDVTYDTPQMQMPYCPYCGARMDLEEDK